MTVTYYGYLLHQAQRPKTGAELRAEDARRGELAAAMSGSWTALTDALAASLNGRVWRLRRAGGTMDAGRLRWFWPDLGRGSGRARAGGFGGCRAGRCEP